MKTRREVHLERLRPAELNGELARCPLVFQPMGPLEYHGPHLPVGTDAINAAECALEACQRFGAGVVSPTLFWGTERERPSWMLQSLGFKPDEWIVGMDFPTATWKSHYAPEHIFALVVASRLEALIAGGYRVIVLVNGHGATNQLQTLERLAVHYSHASPCLVTGVTAVSAEPPEGGFGGHADLGETSLMLRHQEAVDRDRPMVDLTALPPRAAALHYEEFSVVDGRGFSKSPDPRRIVHDDPRDATLEKGRRLFEGLVAEYIQSAESGLKEKGCALPVGR
jgi:creatinine amidohydrolase